MEKMAIRNFNGIHGNKVNGYSYDMFVNGRFYSHVYRVKLSDSYKKIPVSDIMSKIKETRNR